MPVTIGCAYFLIQKYGIRGGLTALIVGGTLLALCLWASFSRKIYSKNENTLLKKRKKNLMFKLSK
jgi:hypothetical protein